jgi:hypothetical protein
LALPSGSTGSGPTKTLGGGDGEFTVWDVSLCSPMSKAALLPAFAASAKAHGWLHSDWFPANGEVESPCGDLACWAKDTRYVTFNHVEDGYTRPVVTYHVRLATPPPAPQCGSSSGYDSFLFSKPAYPGITDGYDHLALPPLTTQERYAAAGSVYVELCSAGSAAMVKAFMAKQLLAAGWVPQPGQTDVYTYANTFSCSIEDGPGGQIKAALHWGSPGMYTS